MDFGGENGVSFDARLGPLARLSMRLTQTDISFPSLVLNSPTTTIRGLL